MAVIVNDVELTDAEMAEELPLHAEAENPVQRAMTALVLRRILLDEAARLEIIGPDHEATIEALLEKEVQVPTPDDQTCRRYYEQHQDRFTVGQLLEADHILFQVTPHVDLVALRSLAQDTLTTLMADPSTFAEQARTLSNCPSGAVGGSLGQVARGDTAPEFERAIFAMQAPGLLPRLLETRYGLHIVKVNRRIEGRLQPYVAVAASIAHALAAASRDTAWKQYIKLLVGRARIEGIEMEGTDSLLVQ
ncbi:peptidylprolyl isomerase [Pollutimonas subterranea]|uniref:peptidylprolyl isomerase n=1 Tax=Pollutimonas subterranea TaxID=2045210 RepID=A0A2N4U6X5_9BURK|nr:peptidylprolyl isomerase [Pollutimonas subterranea]PLC50768.1 peptidylprolyl isomerase [Pollutimonas subterranea]